MAFSTGGRGPFQGQMNVTPLIDVLLVLIIVFMVVESMTKDKGLEAQVPQPATEHANNTPPPERTIVLQIVWTGKLPGSPPAWRSFRIEPAHLPLRDIRLNVARFTADSFNRVTLPPKNGRLSGVRNTFIGHPPRPVVS